MLGHKAKKSLGQNFLTAQSVVNDIVRAGKVTPEDTVLEIGPGKGVLTRALLKTGCRVLAVEKDDSLFVYLSEEFKEYTLAGTFVLHNADILDILPDLALPDSYKLIANIPYNITGKIISDFLSSDKKPSLMVLMVQYEVAARIASPAQKPSILSMAVKAYGQAKLVKKVSAGSFYPKPRVDSAVLLIDSISSDFFANNTITEEIFFKTLKSGFAHKRKKLSSNLREYFPQIEWVLLFEKLLLSKDIRAENLSLQDWASLAKNIE